jgi:2TM domain
MPDTTPNYSNYPDSYSQEDIQAILHLAIANHPTDEELSRQQLWEIAAELDISNSMIQAAEKSWLEQRAIDRRRSAFNLVRRQKFQGKLAKYAIFNTFFVIVNLSFAGTLSWSLYILLFWGLGVALSGWKAYQSSGEEYERAFQRWSFQNDVKETVATVWTKVQRSWQT